MTREEKAEIRRTNLRRFVNLHLKGNLSELARKYAAHTGLEPRPNFFSDLFRAKKGFAENLAEALEEALRLVPGQLSLPDSPLQMKEPPPKTPAEQIQAELDSLDAEEAGEVLSFIHDLKTRRKTRRRASR